MMLMDLCRYREAEDMSANTWRSMMSCPDLGDKHPITQICAGNWARILRHMGRLPEAQGVLQAALESIPDEPFHTKTGTVLISIFARVLLDQQDFSECEIRCRDVVRAAHLLSDFGPDTVFTIIQEAQLAVVLAMNKRYSIAERLLRRSLTRVAQKLGTDHPYALRVAKELAHTLRFQGRVDEACSIYKRTLEIQKSILGSTHPDTLSTMSGLSMVYIAQDKCSQAKLMLEQVLMNLDHLFKDAENRSYHPDIQWTRGKLDDLQTAQAPSPGANVLEGEAWRATTEYIWREPLPQRNPIKRPSVCFANGRYYQLDFPDNPRKPSRTLSGRSYIVEKSKKRSERGQALRLAAQMGDPEKVSELAGYGQDIVNSEGGLWGTPLAAACLCGNLEVVECLLGRGANVNARSGAALRNAARRNHTKVVRRLLSAQADVSAVDDILGTPLRAALAAGNSEIFQILIEHDKDAKLDAGPVEDVLVGTSLQRAALDGNERMVDILLRRGSDPGEDKGQFGSALELAAFANKPEVLQRILAAQGDLSVQAFNGALQQAILSGERTMVEMFLPSSKHPFAARNTSLITASVSLNKVEKTPTHKSSETSEVQFKPPKWNSDGVESTDFTERHQSVRKLGRKLTFQSIRPDLGHRRDQASQSSNGTDSSMSPLERPLSQTFQRAGTFG